jgi:DNA-binding NarL/FixJ family response regulator
MKTIIVTKELHYDESDEQQALEIVAQLQRQGYDVLARVGAVVEPVAVRRQPTVVAFTPPSPEEIDREIQAARGQRSLEAFATSRGVSCLDLLSWITGSRSPTEAEWALVSPQAAKVRKKSPPKESQKSRILELRSRGLKIREIAIQCGVTQQTVRKHLPPLDRDRPGIYYGGVPEETQAKILCLAREGVRRTHIAKRFRIAASTVHRILASQRT